MIYTEKFKIPLKDIGKDNKIKNRAVLEILENIACYHSDLVGYGVNNIKETKVTWILLDWKLKVINRPTYGQVLTVNTWGKGMNKFFTYRDYEIYDNNNNLCAIATSKWALIDTEKGKMSRLTENIINAYKQVIDSGVDVVIIATPPVFRPVHFQYATEKGKHSFLEKPICVDPVGYRTIMATAKQAEAKNLRVITGTQRHHQRPYVESYKKIMEGMIGEITGGTVYWNQSMLWFRERQKEWNDCEYMIKDWVNWKWLSGDHIVEQHVHNIDVFTWFSGLKPVKAVGFGSRHRRVTGDQYDNFSIDFTMENGIHMHSMCRQIDGCVSNVSEFIQGTKGSWDSSTMEIKDLAGNVVWKYDYEAEKANFKQTDPYTLEHVNWINSIRGNKPLQQASETAISNMAAIMGRESAYSGAETTWDAMTASPLDYTPKDLNLGKMDMSTFTVPVPGKPRDQNK